MSHTSEMMLIICYTGINIPYGSMASAISDNPTDRTSLSNWRTIGATLAQTAIGVVLPLVVYYTDEAGNSVYRSENDAWCFGMFNRSSDLLYALL